MQALDGSTPVYGWWACRRSTAALCWENCPGSIPVTTRDLSVNIISMPAKGLLPRDLKAIWRQSEGDLKAIWRRFEDPGEDRSKTQGFLPLARRPTETEPTLGPDPRVAVGNAGCTHEEDRLWHRMPRDNLVTFAFNSSFWLQNSSFWIQNSSFWIQKSSFWIQNSPGLGPVRRRRSRSWIPWRKTCCARDPAANVCRICVFLYESEDSWWNHKGNRKILLLKSHPGDAVEPVVE